MKGSISTVDLLLLISCGQLLFIVKLYFSLFKTKYLNEEVNCTQPSPSVRVPCTKLSGFVTLKSFPL
jgi:hypothetical protein